MKTLNTPSAVLLASLLLAACGGEEPLSLRTQSASSPSQPVVRLMHAIATTWCPPTGGCYGSNKGYAHGYIEVDNLAFHKQVVVHYNVRQTSQWHKVAASYVRPSKNNREIWYFETPKYSYPPRLSSDFQFAIGYTVNGRTYWDNNRGLDYRVGDGPRPMWPRVALGRSNLVLNWARAYNNGPLQGDIVLKDIAYHKQVKVVYSTDGWGSVKSVNATYFNHFCGALDCGSNKKLQRWGFTVNNLPASAQHVKFALSYTAAGDTFWDNNFKRDYVMTVPGKLHKP